MERKLNKHGQSKLFDIAGIRDFCNDKDINDIVSILDRLVQDCGLTSVKNWTSWKEVPELGECMVYDIRYDMLPCDFMKELVKCKLLAKRKSIDLAIYPEQTYYSDSKKHLVIYSRFLDMERRIRETQEDEQHIAECIA